MADQQSQPLAGPTPGPDRRVWRIARRVGVFALVGVALVAGGWLAVTRLLPLASQPTAPAAAYRLVPATEGTIEGRVAATGTLALVGAVTVSTRGAGNLTELRVAVGDEVKAGQVLALLDTSTVRTSLTQAELALDTARAKLDQAKKPYTEADVSAARAAVEAAKLKQQQAATPYTAADLAGAELAVEQARQKLELVRSPYTAAELETQRAAVRQAEFAAQNARYNLVAVQKSDVVSKNVRDREYEHNFYETAYGKAQDRYKKGEIEQDKVTLEWNNLMTAKEKLDAARAQSASALASAENQIVQADTNLAAAKTKLADMEAGPKATDIKSAQLALDQATLKLTTMRAGPTAGEVESARVALLSAEQKLTAMLAGPDALAVRIAQNGVDSAQASVVELQAQLAATEVKSPTAGVVVALGESGTAPVLGTALTIGTAIATVADMTQLQVKGTVNEIDAAQVRRGQTAEVQVAAAPGRAFPGQVVAVDSQATTAQGVVSYGVVVRLDARAASAGLKPGMTATAQILTGRSERAVLVPIEALQKVRGNWAVLVPDAQGTVQTRPITLGIMGQTQVEIATGLKADEAVAIPLKPGAATTRTDQRPPGADQPAAPVAPVSPAGRR